MKLHFPILVMVLCVSAHAQIPATSPHQPKNANLTSIAALATTAFGRSVLETADASALKTLAGLASVENTALSTWTGTTNVTTLGTVVTGVWNGTAIPVLYGGTGATTQADARTNLGLVIGTNVQAWNTKLDALAGVANSEGVYANNGSGAMRLMATSQGGNGVADDSKILRFDSNGGLTLSLSLSVLTGTGVWTNYHGDRIDYTDGTWVQTIRPATLTASRTHYLPNRSGTLLHEDGSGASLTGLSPYQLAQVSASDGQALAWNTANSRWQPLTPITAVATKDFDLTAVIVEDLTMTVTGAVAGDVVQLGVPPASVTATAQFTAWVSAADTVTIRCRTAIAGENPASGSFRATITRH